MDKPCEICGTATSEAEIFFTDKGEICPSCHADLDLKKNLRKVFPDHWSFMLGEVALWSFVVLLLTGVFLTLWFHPGGTFVAGFIGAAALAVVGFWALKPKGGAGH